MTGLHPSGNALRSQFNGAFPDGTLFAAYFPTLEAPPYGSTSASAQTNFTPVGEVTDISTRFAFTITSYDLASFASNFEVVNACPADVQQDGIVGVADLTEVILHWGDDVGFDVPADVNGDQDVDAQDLVEVLINWGDCP